VSISSANVFPGAVLRPTNYYGYPTVGASRRRPPSILGVIHCTDGFSVPTPSSTKSWTFSVAPNGTVYQFMDPVIAVAWTNGYIKSPDTSNPLIKAMVGSKFNPNEFCFVTIENVCYVSGGQRLTQAQLDADRRILEWASKLSGLPIDRQHVIGHYQINGETRINCPTVPSDRQRVFSGVLGTTLPDTAIANQEINMHLRPVAELWSIHPDAPYWVNGPDPRYGGPGTVPANEPTGTFAGTAPGMADVSIAEEWKQDANGNWTSGDWRVLRFPPGTPNKTSVVWVHRRDMDALRPGGTPAFDKLVTGAYFGTDYDPATDTVKSSSILDCSTAVSAAVAPLNDRLNKVHTRAAQLASMATDLTKA
jgi:hypothetical protein